MATSPTFQRLPESTQMLYAELLEQAIHAEAEAAALGVPHGSFVAKTIKGGTYWYLQRMEGRRRRQLYLGGTNSDVLVLPDEQAPSNCPLSSSAFRRIETEARRR